MKVKDILRQKGSDVVTIREDRTIREAISMMVRNKIGGLLVLDADKKIVGIITERDMLRIFNGDPGDIDHVPVSEKMVRRIIIGDPEDTLEYIEKIMTENRIRHVPIVSEDRLVGIISIGDIVKAQSSSIRVENRYLKNYIEGR